MHFVEILELVMETQLDCHVVSPHFASAQLAPKNC